MEDEQFVSRNFDETPPLYQGFQTDRFVEKGCLNIPETISEKSSPSLDEDNLKITAFQALTICLSSDNKENIGSSVISNNSAISDESTVCEMKPFNSSNLMKCERKLLDSSNDEEKSFELEKKPIDRGKLLQISEKLKFHNDTISTPPSALREQINMLRKEMNEAYEFHDLEIQVLKEERKEDPENYVQLIENYSTLLKLYSSLKNEYEEYRRDQDKIRNEFQNKTVNCLESLCSQIETSDNSLNSASFVSFSTDLKCSTMIDNFIEKETTLTHDVTIQTKDPLSDTNVFKTPKWTPFKSENECFLPNLIHQGNRYDSENNIKLIEVETVLSDKAKEIEKLEQRLFKIEDLSGLLQNEFERISMAVSKENETLKANLLNKSKQLDALTQQLFTEIISLNPDLVDSLTDEPGTKLLPVFIETIMERCKNIEDKLTMKFNNEKSHLETKVKNLKEENINLNTQISQVSALQELKNSNERQILEMESMILTRDEEIRMLKIHEMNMTRMQENLAKEREEEVTRLEAQLILSASHTKELEDRYQILEQTSSSLRLELEKIKELCEATEKENYKLKERLSEIEMENSDLKEVSERLKRQLSENVDVISARDEEIQNLKNRDLKELKAALTQADEIILQLKAELFTAESGKLNFEKRCLEIENTNSTLQAVINTKDNILKELECFKSSWESERENNRLQIREKEVIISDLSTELDMVKQKYLVEVTKMESLTEKISNHTSEFAELEKSYKVLERKLADAEGKIEIQVEEMRILQLNGTNFRQAQNDLASAKEIIERLEAKLLIAENEKEALERRCQGLEEKCNNLSLNLERMKSDCTNIELENENFKKLIHQKNKDIEFENLFKILKEGLENLKLSSAADDFPKIMKQAMVHVKKLESKAAELKEENEKLDEECDSYAKVIKDLKKEAAVEWKKNNEKTQTFEKEILRLTGMKNGLDDENKELLEKISKLEEECQKLKAGVTVEGRDCGCGGDLKKVKELKRTILVKEQKLLELQDMEAQNSSYKSQIEYLKNALDKERKKINEEREKNKKLQNELNEAIQSQKTDNKKFDENEILEELRMRGSISGGVVGEIVDKEKMRKLSKDVGVLKEICRARYAEIKRLEAENAALKNSTPKNSNQTHSPIRSRVYSSTRSKIRIVDKWRTEMDGKENRSA